MRATIATTGHPIVSETPAVSASVPADDTIQESAPTVVQTAATDSTRRRSAGFRPRIQPMRIPNPILEMTKVESITGSHERRGMRTSDHAE